MFEEVSDLWHTPLTRALQWMILILDWSAANNLKPVWACCVAHSDGHGRHGLEPPQCQVSDLPAFVPFGILLIYSKPQLRLGSLPTLGAKIAGDKNTWK